MVVLLTWASELVTRASARTRLLVVVGTAAFMLSELVPTLWLVVGKMDVFLLLVAPIAARAVDRRRYILAGTS